MATEASTSQGTSTAKTEPSVEAKNQSTVERSQAVIRNNIFWALGAGVVPVPGLDLVAVLGVQVKLLKQLSDVYGLKFSEDIARKAVASLLSSVGAVGIGTLVGGSLVKLVPFLGTTLGFVSVPVFSAAATHAVGTVFMMHFETGGTLLDFNPTAMRAHFKQEFERAKIDAARFKPDSVSKA